MSVQFDIKTLYDWCSSLSEEQLVLRESIKQYGERVRAIEQKVFPTCTCSKCTGLPDVMDYYKPDEPKFSIGQSVRVIPSPDGKLEGDPREWKVLRIHEPTPDRARKYEIEEVRLPNHPYDNEPAWYTYFESRLEPWGAEEPEPVVPQFAVGERVVTKDDEKNSRYTVWLISSELPSMRKGQCYYRLILEDDPQHTFRSAYHNELVLASEFKRFEPSPTPPPTPSKEDYSILIDANGNVKSYIDKYRIQRVWKHSRWCAEHHTITAEEREAIQIHLACEEGTRMNSKSPHGITNAFLKRLLPTLSVEEDGS